MPFHSFCRVCLEFARHMVKNAMQKCFDKARAVALLARVANQY